MSLSARQGGGARVQAQAEEKHDRDYTNLGREGAYNISRFRGRGCQQGALEY